MVGAVGAQGGGGFDDLGSTSETSHDSRALSPPNRGSQRNLGLHELGHSTSTGSRSQFLNLQNGNHILLAHYNQD